MKTLRSIVLLVFLSVLAVDAVAAVGDDFPNKPIRILTSSPGGGSDFSARLIAQGLAQDIGQPVITDNRAGVLPGEIASKAPPDGYTLMLDGSSFWLSEFTQKLPYDPIRDFAPITIVYYTPQILIVHPSVPVTSVKDLIAYAKANPGKLNYSYSGVGGNSQLSMELFKVTAGVNIVAVAYKSTGQSVSGLLSGETQVMVASQASISPYIKSDKLRALAVTGSKPSPLAPGLPTIAASGLPGYEAIGMQGIFTVAKTPQAIIKKLNQGIVRVLTKPEIREKYFNIGVEVVGSTPEEFAAALKSDMTKWSKVIKDAGIKGD